MDGLALTQPQAIEAGLRWDSRYRFIQSLPKGAQVLDAGCGAFRALQRFRSWRADLEFSGVDLMDVTAQCPSGVQFKQMNLEHDRLPFPDASFDAITFCHVLEHLVYPLNLAGEFLRVLKPKGRIYVEGPSIRALFLPTLPFIASPSRSAIGDDLNFFDNVTHVRPLTPRSVQMFLEFSGCRPERIGFVRNPWKVLMAPLLILGGLMLFRRRWLCVGMWELAGWSIYGVGCRTAATKPE